jgi:competence protein ComEA
MARPKQITESPVASYLKFSRSQRRAMLIMLFPSAGLLAFFQWKQKTVSQSPYEAFVETENLQAIAVKQSFPGKSSGSFAHYPVAKRKTGSDFKPAALSLKPAPFDPNKVSFEELTGFGLSEKAANNILHYREKGGRFKKPEDLEKIYSLAPNETAQLIPFVKIEAVAETGSVAGSGMSGTELISSAAPAKYKPVPISINVNLADSMSWQLLPGIGAKRASSILKFREKLGGFVSIEQVGETYGLPDSIFRKIRNSLLWEPGQIEQLSLNNATEAELKSHPYIGWQWAKLIVAYRNQHGPYQSVDDLMKIHIMKKEWLDKVRPYLKTD